MLDLIRKSGFPVAAIFIWLSCSGCPLVVLGAAGAGAATVYVKGNLEDQFTQPVPRVHEAARAALRDLGLPIVEDKGDQVTAHLESEFSDGKHVWIDVDAQTDGRTRVKIRVGELGDEIRSRKILDAIKQNL
jgi:hypothetical protein